MDGSHAIDEGGRQMGIVYSKQFGLWSSCDGTYPRQLRPHLWTRNNQSQWERENSWRIIIEPFWENGLLSWMKSFLSQNKNQRPKFVRLACWWWRWRCGISHLFTMPWVSVVRWKRKNRRNVVICCSLDAFLRCHWSKHILWGTLSVLHESLVGM